MNNQESLIGKKFTRLEVLDEYSRNWYKYLMCKCDCGKYDNLEDAAKARREWEIENFKEYSPFMSGREVNYV